VPPYRYGKIVGELFEGVRGDEIFLIIEKLGKTKSRRYKKFRAVNCKTGKIRILFFGDDSLWMKIS